MGQNYLHANHSPQVNALLAATGWNLKKLMTKLQKELKKYFFSFFHLLPNQYAQISL